MTTNEQKTLKEVLNVLHMAEARIRSLPDDALADPDYVFTTATLILNNLKPAIQAHRAANIEAHKLIKGSP
jgi:hypothetical protein